MLDGQEPVLKFLFSAHITEFTLDEKGDVVEGEEDEVQVKIGVCRRIFAEKIDYNCG